MQLRVKVFNVPGITGAATTATTSRALPAKVLPSPEVEAATIHTIAMMFSDAPSSPKPGCSTWLDNTETDRRPTTPQQSKFHVAGPQQILPLPATRKTSRVTRKRGKTAIITASPYKTELEETIKKKKLLEESKQKRKEIRQLKLGKQKKTGGKRTVISKKKVRGNRRWSSTNSESNTENTPCLYCSGLYLESNEGWVACSMCGNWAHCSCAGVDDEDDEATFTCEFCEE